MQEDMISDIIIILDGGNYVNSKWKTLFRR